MKILDLTGHISDCCRQILPEGTLFKQCCIGFHRDALKDPNVFDGMAAISPSNIISYRKFCPIIEKLQKLWVDNLD